MQWNLNCIYFLFLPFAFVVVLSLDPYLGIVGGRNFEITQQPWQVYLEILLDSGFSSDVEECGGAIVNERWILTAAHCTEQPDVAKINVRVGSTYRDRGGNVIPVASIIVHGKFDASTLDYDFSLIQLHEPININDFTTKAISLPNPSDYIHSNSRCFVAGWGVTNEFDMKSVPKNLQGVEVSIVSHSFCQNMYQFERLTDRMICAASKTGDKNFCSGDSGSPLICETVNGLWKQFGIVSAVAECASPDSPGIYSRVQSVRSWIWKYTGT